MHLAFQLQAHSARQPKRSTHQADDQKWRRDLPARSQGLVVAPIHIDMDREYEILAERTCGYDENDEPCCYRQLQTTFNSDEDDFYNEEPLHAELLTAWRLRDEGWLIFRKISGSDEYSHFHSFYAFSAFMPR